MADTYLVKDINPGDNGSSPSLLSTLNDKLYFVAADNAHGRELWSSDGTEMGTHLVKDIFPGGEGSDPGNFIVLNNQLYFVANDGIHGNELWRSDGTEGGTTLVKDIFGGEESSYPGYFTVFNNRLYFLARNDLYGSKLWSSDGTEAGTVLVKNIYVYYSPYFPVFTVFNNNLYFWANDGIYGQELWSSDGTEVGTTLVKDISPGSESSNSSHIVILNNQLYFRVGEALWSTDGTEAGTRLVNNIYLEYLYDIEQSLPSTSADILLNNKQFYVNSYSDYGNELWVRGNELWVQEGSQPEVMLKDIYPGHEGSNPTELTVFKDKLYFTANDSVHGVELWVTDGVPEYPVNSGYNLTLQTTGTGSGTVSSTGTSASISCGTNCLTYLPLAVIYLHAIPDSDSTFAGWSTGCDDYPFIPSADTVCTATFNKTDSYHLTLATAGTGTGTVSSFGTSAGISCGTNCLTYFPSTFITLSVIPDSGSVFIGWSEGCNDEMSLRADTTCTATLLLLPVSPDEGTHLVKDINPENSSPFYPYSNGVFEPVMLNNKSYFWANDGLHGWELWSSDGSGTTLVKDIMPGEGGSIPKRTPLILRSWEYYSYSLGIFKNRLYFWAADAQGWGVWTSDGTEIGTVKIKNLLPYYYHPVTGFAQGIDQFNEFITSNDKLYFMANDNIHGLELWSSDGTEEGTTLVKDIAPGKRNSYNYAPTVINDKLYFNVKADLQLGSINTCDLGLWVSDGTEAGTTPVEDTSLSLTTCIATFEQINLTPTVIAPFPPLVFNGASAQTIKLFTHFTAAKNSDEPLTYSVVANSNPTVVMPNPIVSSEGNLTLLLGEAGLSTLTIQAQDWRGATVTTDLRVAVLPEVVEEEMKPGQVMLPTGETRVSAAQFWGGWSINAQGFFPEAQVTLADTVTVLGKIKVAPEDSGKKAEIVVYATYLPLSIAGVTSPQYLMLDTQGQVLSWDGKPKNLVPFQRDIVLEPMQIVYAYQGQLIVPAKVDVYLGYRLEDGTLVSSQVMNLMAE
ncbi:hypothetical protein THII_0516 [Thioploca ingrica]|uniref:Bacterial repeat domain-containing protein n=1 Tax=Thioploca ingrica TaxID=40754 RepID=A0A090AB85_9GAMM|nr:hypothetical protein THII_0516 [Thioploca ingrica]